jgi:transposase
MRNPIVVGCDLHDETMLLKVAVGQEAPRKECYANDRAGRRAMIRKLAWLSQAQDGAQVVFAYEACGLGFGLHDELVEAGMRCHVLAPTRMTQSIKHRHSKTDERDAQRILEIVRGHVLAGNELPDVWVPDRQTRDEREVVRARLDLSEKLTALKTQVRALLKRNHQVAKPEALGAGWTKPYRAWLRGLACSEAVLLYGARVALASLLRQIEAVEEEIDLLDEQVKVVAVQERNAQRAEALMELKGVGLLTAMVFLVEMGDLGRFGNRRQVGSYLGLVPTSDETGEAGERKGHITHQGPQRLRKALCQAVWSRVRTDPHEKAVYERIAAKNPNHKKIAVVAAMRRLGIRMWHVGLRAEGRARAAGQCVKGATAP